MNFCLRIPEACSNFPTSPWLFQEVTTLYPKVSCFQTNLYFSQSYRLNFNLSSPYTTQTLSLTHSHSLSLSSQATSTSSQRFLVIPLPILSPPTFIECVTNENSECHTNISREVTQNAHQPQQRHESSYETRTIYYVVHILCSRPVQTFISRYRSS